MSGTYSQKLPLVAGLATFAERQSINNIIDGRTQNYGEVTATASTALTTVTAIGMQAESAVFLEPMSAQARSDYHAGTAYISDVRDNAFDITHSSSAATALYRYAWIG